MPFIRVAGIVCREIGRNIPTFAAQDVKTELIFLNVCLVRLTGEAKTGTCIGFSMRYRERRRENLKPPSSSCIRPGKIERVASIMESVDRDLDLVVGIGAVT